jgi:hypothetical protein
MKQDRWLGRKARWIKPDRNPLRRKLDRVEVFIFGGLIVAAAAGAPVAAITAGHWAHTAAARAAQQERESSFQTQAVLLASPSATLSGYTVTATGSALAQWTTSAGASRDGVVPVPAGSAKGSTVPIWTTAAGNITSPPLTPSQVASQGSFAATLAAVCTVLACLVAALTTRLVTNRRRMAAWDADWALKAPLWNRQSW